MPPRGDGKRSHRKGHFSCDFCRSRKLRCDRPLPCANCVSRGKNCNFGQQREQERPERIDNGTLTPQPSLQNSQSQDNATLLAEMQSLKGLVKDLQKRVTNQSPYNQSHHQQQQHSSGLDGGLSLSAASPSNTSSSRIDESAPPPSAPRGEVGEVVAHLELVSMGHVSYKYHTAGTASPTWNPQRLSLAARHNEARILVDKFISNVSYIHHVVHHPSLHRILDDVYRQINSQQEPVQLGHVVLLISIFASVANLWGPRDDQDHQHEPLFSSFTQANAQTSFWIKQAYELLEGSETGPPVALETVQGIVILSFLICNIQGVLLRYRSFISMGLLVCRELGIHWTDRESEFAVPNTIHVEMGRRVWWYLVATDWLLAARHSGPAEGVYQTNPKQMRVGKPRNINDVDLVDGGLNLNLPITQPTEMSYFLQRIRLAEISRSIVDQRNDSEDGASAANHDAQYSAISSQLDQMIQDIPPFLHIGNYRCSVESTTNSIFIQAYMLNSIIHTQRCKLHLRYLASKPNDRPNYALSREKCLISAREIIQAEAQFESSHHPFVWIRLRLSSILFGVFLAGIVLLMDSCVTAMRLQQDEVCLDEDAAEALRIIDSARTYSLAAANLHNSLMQVLARHRIQQQQNKKQQLRESQPQETPEPPMLKQTPDSQTPTDSMSATIAPTSYQDPHHDPSFISNTANPVTNTQSTYYDTQLDQGWENLMEMDAFQWDDIFSGLDTASFF